MFPSHPLIAIIGSGAIGSYYGARLAQSGLPVHFLLRSDYDHVRAKGMVIQSIAGDFSLPSQSIQVYRSTAEMPRVDLVIVALKSTDNAALADLIPPLLHQDTAILTLQNGLGNEELLASLFGAERVLGGVAFTCINRLAPGMISHTDHGRIELAEFSQDTSDERSQSIAKLFNDAKIPTSVIPNLMQTRWAKLTWNIPFNGLTATLDVPTDQLIATAEGASVVSSLIDEIIATAASTGIYLPQDIAARQIALTRSMGSYLTSTQLDRRHGRPLELEAIFLRPLAIARANHLPVPTLEMLVFCLQTINNGAACRTP